MRSKNEVLTELIDVSSDYERICTEIRAKENDLSEYKDHIETLKLKRDGLRKKIDILHKELTEASSIEE